MLTERKRIGDILIQRGVITREQLNEALELQRLTPAPLGSILSHLGFIDEDALTSVLSEEFAVKSWNLKLQPPDPAAVNKLPGDIAKSYKVLPVALRGDTLYLAMSNPEDVEALDVVTYTTRLKVEPVLTARHRLLQMIDRFHGDRINTEIGPIINQAVKAYAGSRPNERVETATAETVPIISLVNQIIVEGVRAGASDIHIEPTDFSVEISYRVDGLMKPVSEIPSALLQPLTIRMKIMAGIDIIENFIPVDGRISMVVDDHKVDLRLSVMPSHYGNRMVIRVLDQVRGLKMLDELGFLPKSLRMFRHLIARPYGMFLVTGPTGSGKTTTLYAAVLELKESAINIMTCEDPIEYEIAGVSQSQINEAVGLTFERQITALMRQDPDVILIGEMRDQVTAQAAFRAALTGHMALSTMQCNDAPSAVPRLMDLGIDPYLLSTSLTGVSSQRLLRMLCLNCRRTRPLTRDEQYLFEVYQKEPPKELPVPVGCPSCKQTGYAGRNAIHEVMPITTEVAGLIADRAPVGLMRDAAKKAGFVPMQERALDIVLKGAVTFEDAQRMVALDPDYGTFAQMTD